MNNDFVSREPQSFRFKLGTVVASSLSGFIAGVLVTTIFWLLYIAANK